MIRRIAVMLSKGGVGKTTTAVTLAAGLAIVGRRVLLIDTDTQNQAADALGVAAVDGLTALVDGESSLDSATVEARNGLFLLSGGESLAGLERTISRKEYGGERVLLDVLAKIDNDFDYVIVDSSPSWGPITINTLFYASEILTPISTEAMALRGLLKFIKRLDGVKTHNSNLELRYVLPTFLDGRVRKSGEIFSQLQAHFGGLVCDPIRYNASVSEAAGYGKTIFEYAPKSRGAIDYANLIERIRQDE